MKTYTLKRTAPDKPEQRPDYLTQANRWAKCSAAPHFKTMNKETAAAALASVDITQQEAWNYDYSLCETDIYGRLVIK